MIQFTIGVQNLIYENYHIERSVLVIHFEDFRNLERQLQIDSLINFFVKKFSRISELAMDLETDPLDNVVFD